MWRPLALLLACLIALPAAAQDNVIIVPLDPIDPTEVLPADPGLPADQPLVIEGDDLIELEAGPPPVGSVIGEEVITVEEDRVARGTGAILRGLDKLAGSVEEFRLAAGDTVRLGWLEVTLGECRYPENNPSGEAYAWIVVRETAGEAPIFEGWMIASAPALNALDHARYDVWVNVCTTD